MGERTFWWCGWLVDSRMPLEAMRDAWPAGMKGWQAGLGFDTEAWVGLVWAESAEAAHATVLDCYSEEVHDLVTQRWEPIPKTVEEVMRSRERFPLEPADVHRLMSEGGGEGG